MHVLLYSIIIICCVYIHAENIVIAGNETTTKIFLALVCHKSDELLSIAPVIQRDCMFSGQYIVDVGACASLSEKKYKKWCKRLFNQGYILAIFMRRLPDKSIQWCLIDTAQTAIIYAKRSIIRNSNFRSQGHIIADQIWPILSGVPGCFSTKIAYSKETIVNGNIYKYICVADYDGFNECIIVDTPTINIAPRWNNDPHKPLIFYSAYTPTNICLMITDLHKNKKIASNFDGINMLPAFSPDGTKAAYCASLAKGNCQIFYCNQYSIKNITHNAGNNISPVFVDSDTIYFCSDAFTGVPILCRYDLKNNSIIRIAETGYYFSLHYNQRNNSLVYTKIIDSIMQLYIYNIITGIHQQLTFDHSNKHECCWSPCGTYIMYVESKNGRGRLACFNTITSAISYITPEKSNCSYPSWSGWYNNNKKI